MRNQQEDDLVVDLGGRDRAEEVLEERNLAQARPSADALVLFLVKQAAEQVDLALLEPDHLIDGALADDRLGHAADGGRAALGRNLDLQLERDVAVEVDGRLHVDVHADIDVLELGLHRADAAERRTADSVGERTGCDRDARADLERRLLAVGGAKARILKHLGIAVAEQQIGLRLADGDGESRLR